jgi:serine/threonine-protein kinase
MGEVYRARDTRLKRHVALKVLPALFAHDPERMTRFQREAEMLASLSHPNIATIHGVEQGALVMELVEGESLPAPLPLTTALEYARQIAEALEYAHERGVVHRDLKPANVKVTPEGIVKVLDFGLAKAIQDGPAATEDPSASPTRTLSATRAGVIMGTAAYMAPEQANGKPADRRSDVFSFGAVLYEMLSGRRAFSGESISDTLASVLKVEPDWGALPRDTPASVRTLVRRCLTKDRRQRLQAIGEARIVLEHPGAQAGPAHRSRSWPWISAIAALAAVAAVAVWGWLQPSAPGLRPSVGVAAGTLPALDVARPQIAISPDASHVAYPTRRGIHLRELNRPEGRLAPGTENASGPLGFSPDGRELVFFVSLAGANRLKRLTLESGAVTDLFVQSRPLNLPVHWGSDDSIYFASPAGLVRRPARGESREEVLLPSSEGRYFPVSLLPDGRTLLVAGLRTETDEGIQIEALVVPTRERRRVASVPRSESPELVSFSFAPAVEPGRGYLMYGSPGSVFAMALDLDRVGPEGEPLPIRDVSVPFALSRAGTLAFATGAQATCRTLVWVDRQNVERPVDAPCRRYQPPLRLSPNGEQLAVQIDGELWIVDLGSGRLYPIAPGGASQLWSRDSKLIFYTREGPNNTRAIASVPVDRSRPPVTLTTDDGFYVLNDIDLSGAILARREDPANLGAGVTYFAFSVSADGTRLEKGKPFLTSSSQIQNLTVSPGGDFVAYQVVEGDLTQIDVRPYPGPGAATRISVAADGGRAPQWLGRQLFYVNVSKPQLMVVDVKRTTPEFEASSARALLEEFREPYDVARQGFLRFRISGDRPSQLNLVTNFVDELGRLAALK